MSISVRKEAEAERQKLKNTSWKDRAWCVWEYYKFHILALILVADVLQTTGAMIYRQTFIIRLPITTTDGRAGTTSPAVGLEAGLKETPECDSKDLVKFNEGLSAGFSESSVSQYDYATLAKTSALVASRSLDAVIGDQASIDHYVSINAYQSLEEYLPPELYHKVKDYMYRVNDEQDSLQSSAVSLEDIAFVQETGILMNPSYLAVIPSVPHEEAAPVIVGYLFPWPMVGCLHPRLVTGYLLPWLGAECRFL